MASVAILSHRSLLKRGEPYDIPDFHNEEELVRYENDTLTPFYGDHGEAPTLPCCSHPSFQPSKEDVEKYLDKTIISISAKENTGIIELENTIKEMFFHGEVSYNDEVYITNIRQKNSLQEALSSLHLVVRSIEDAMPEDFYSIDLMNAYESLGKMIGESVEDDLVNEIFSKFCMGK